MMTDGASEKQLAESFQKAISDDGAQTGIFSLLPSKHNSKISSQNLTRYG
jgi:hypothetical protein